MDKEQRVYERREIDLGEGVALRLTLGSHTREATPQDLSAQGIGLVLDPTGLEPTLLEPGQNVGVTYTSSLAKGLKVLGVITNVSHLEHQGKPVVRLGICFLEKDPGPQPSLDNTNRRQGERYLCPEFLRPMATASSPFFFGDYLHFQVLDFGKNSMGCLTSIRNKTLIKGLELTLTLTFPILGNQQVKARVAHITPLDLENRLRVGFEFVDPSPTFLVCLSEFLLFIDKTLTPKTLKEAGFRVRNVSQSVQFDYARTREDYNDILQLRLESYQKEGRFLNHQAPQMANTFDTYSRHLVARFNKKIIASSRLTFVEGQSERSHLASVCHYAIPPNIWNGRFLEWGNFVIHHDFQKTDLFREFARHVVKNALLYGGKYLLGAAEKHLVPLYQALGFDIIDDKVVSPLPGWEVNSCCLCLDLEKFEDSRMVPGSKEYDVLQGVWHFYRSTQNPDGVA